MKNKWYQNTIVIILLLILLFPLGMILMWRYTNWDKEIKKFITIIMFPLLLSIGYFQVSSYIENTKIKDSSSSVTGITDLNDITESTSNSDNSATNNTTITNSNTIRTVTDESKKVKLLVAAKDGVKEKLKSPSSAKFPLGTSYYTFSTYPATTSGMQGYLVKGYVESKNSFGTMLKTSFIVQLDMDYKGDRYRIIQVVFDE